MSNEPSWLANSSSAAASSPPVASSGASTPSLAASAVDANDADLPGLILTMRLANMGVSLALMTVSIIKMIGFPSLSIWVLAVYATCGGLLVCCLETQLKFMRVMIAVNFGFLFDPVWRFIFYVLMASITWSFDDIMGKIVAGFLIGVACYNTFVLFKYPTYRKLREQIAEEEDKRIEARISKEVRKQAVTQLSK